jgi:fructose-bisphosphate aldolase class 1
MDTLGKVADDIAAGKGTVGKLLTDSGLHDTALKVLKQISQAIEDAREQAPVSAFTGALFGGFR